MNASRTELFSVLQEFNLWWTQTAISDLPAWDRSAAQ
jgi:hypothetical protein